MDPQIVIDQIIAACATRPKAGSDEYETFIFDFNNLACWLRDDGFAPKVTTLGKYDNGKERFIIRSLCNWYRIQSIDPNSTELGFEFVYYSAMGEVIKRWKLADK